MLCEPVDSLFDNGESTRAELLFDVVQILDLSCGAVELVARILVLLLGATSLQDNTKKKHKNKRSC